jgi:exonuclease III
VGVAILTSNKINFQPKVIKQDRGEHFTFIKGNIHQEKFSVLKISALNARASTLIKETILKFKTRIETHTIKVGDFNTPLSWISMSLKQKLNRNTVKLIEIMNQMDLTDRYRIFHPKTKVYIFFSARHGTFSKINHIISHKQASADTRR